MKKYKIGIIGYGGFGQFLHHWLDKLENVSVIAISDHGHHTKDTSLCHVYADWNELLNDPDIEIVSIVTPPNLHAAMAIAAMKAGKHVMLEKPVATTAESAAQILAAQKETGMNVIVNHMIRYNPIIQAFREFRIDGTFGKLRHATVNNYAQDESLPASHWFWNPKLSGGILVEHGVHFFDIINAISGQNYASVCGASSSRNENQRDRVAAIVSYDDGLIANYYHAFSGPGIFEQTTIQLAFDLARVEIEGWMPLKGKITAMVNSRIKDRLKLLPGLKILQSEKPGAANDDSRPEGWGATGVSGEKREMTYFGGVGYEVDEIVTGTFELPQNKGEVYGKCVQSTLSDLIKKIENPEHEMAVTVEDAATALEIAILATK